MTSPLGPIDAAMNKLYASLRAQEQTLLDELPDGWTLASPGAHVELETTRDGALEVRMNQRYRLVPPGCAGCGCHLVHGNQPQ